MSIDNARGDAAARPRMLGIPEWQLEAAEAVGTNVLDDIVADSRGSWLPLSRRPSRKPQTGNAQQCRRHRALMRHTAANCFPSARSLVSSLVTPDKLGADGRGGVAHQTPQPNPRTHGAASVHATAQDGCDLTVRQSRPVASRLLAALDPQLPRELSLCRRCRNHGRRLLTSRFPHRAMPDTRPGGDAMEGEGSA